MSLKNLSCSLREKIGFAFLYKLQYSFLRIIVKGNEGMHYKIRRRDERELAGTVKSFRLHNPNGGFAEIVVVGYRFVGIFELNVNLLPASVLKKRKISKILSNAMFRLSCDKQGVPMRLYLVGCRIWHHKKDRRPHQTAIKTKKLFVPYSEQSVLSLMTPWEDST